MFKLFHKKKRISKAEQSVLARIEQAKAKYQKHEFLQIIVNREINNFIASIQKANSELEKCNAATQIRDFTIVWSVEVSDTYIYAYSNLSYPIYQTINGNHDDFCSRFNLEKIKYFWDAQALSDFLGHLVRNGVEEFLKENPFHSNYTLTHYHCTPEHFSLCNPDRLIGDSRGKFSINYKFKNPHYIEPNKW